MDRVHGGGPWTRGPCFVLSLLKGNREALCYLPEMLEQLMEMPEEITKVEKATNTLDECR